jgi:CBS domain-containing protein
MSLHMRESFCLASPAGHAAAQPPRLKPMLPRVKINDPAERVMNDFTREGPRSINEDRSLDDARHEMFRWGARALVVTRGQQIVGVVTADDVADDRLTNPIHCGWSNGLRVADVMTDAHEIPAIEWHTVVNAVVRDLLEIFEGTGTSVLIVVDTEGAMRTRVRGFIERHRLNRQLGPLAHPHVDLWPRRMSGRALEDDG